MLYDPKWKTRADPLSITSLIAWLETKQPEETYHGLSPDACMLAQWAKSIDPTAHAILADPDDAFSYFIHGEQVDLDAYKFIALSWPATFGAALKRARAEADPQTW